MGLEMLAKHKTEPLFDKFYLSCQIFTTCLINIHILVYFSLYAHYFCEFQKEKSEPTGPYTHELDKNKEYLSVDNFGILSVFVSTPKAYINLCRDLKYLLKIPYFIRDYPNMAFFIFETVLLVCLVPYIFTRFFEKMCLINTLILVYCHAKYY